MAEYVKTKWHTELDIFHKIKPVIVMEGNIMDSFQYPTDGTIASMPDYLTIYLEEKGYQMIVGYDSIQGFYKLGGTLEGDVLETFHRISQSKTKIEHDNISVEYYDRGTESQGSGSVETAPIIAKRALENNEIPTAIIMNLASRYITCPDNLSQEETDSFTNLLLAADQAAEVDINEGSAKNLLILLVNKTITYL